MFIRYQVVRNTLAALGIAGVLGGGVVAGQRVYEGVDTVRMERAVAAQNRAVAAAAAAAKRASHTSRSHSKAAASARSTRGERSSASAARRERSVDDRIRAALLTGKARGRKAKDAFRGSGQKVNLYDDDGDGRWDRAKQDRDRDGRWDVKWTRRDERINRKPQ